MWTPQAAFLDSAPQVLFGAVSRILCVYYCKVGVTTGENENKTWKKFIILSGPRRGVTTCYTGSQGKITECRSEREASAGVSSGKARQDRVNSLRLAGLNNF